MAVIYISKMSTSLFLFYANWNFNKNNDQITPMRSTAYKLKKNHNDNFSSNEVFQKIK